MIPYGTAAEASWFRYSAAMADYWLLWHNTLILFAAHRVCHAVQAAAPGAALPGYCRYSSPFDATKLIPFHGGAEFHDYHHLVGRQSNSNFSSFFTYCDYIYGTDRGYKCYKANVAKVKAKLARNRMEKDARNGFSSSKVD